MLHWPFLVLFLLLTGVPAHAVDGARAIDAATFWSSDGAPRDVDLPDTWSLRGVPARAHGHYALEFNLSQRPVEPWAVHFSRISPRHVLRLNGELVANAGQSIGDDARRLPTQVLVDLPPELLRPGRNRLHVEVSYSAMGGLSQAQIGPLTDVRPGYDRGRSLSTALPQAMNLAAFGVAVLMCLVWWRCRTLVAIGAFGALSVIATMRGVFSVVGTTGWSESTGTWLTFVSHVWSAVLLGLFAQAFAERRQPGLTRALLIMAACLTAAATWAIPQGLGLELRQWSYPLVIACTLPSLWLCLDRARRMRSRVLGFQAAGAAAFVGAGVHDYAMQTLGLLPISHTFWMPYALPPALMAVSIGLLDRVVTALRRVEGLKSELEVLVAQRTRALEAANVAKTRFLAAASHDLRQPLVSIGLMVEMARERADSHPLRHLLDRANDSIASMEALLSGLLDLSRLDAGTVAVRKQAVSLEQLWAAVEADSCAATAAKGLRLRFRPTSLAVHSDPIPLEQVLRNLVSNAVRYTDRGSVLVAARRREGQVLIEVRDSGCGIPAADHDRIFEEFVQLAPRSVQAAGGLGLGLSIVTRMLALLGHRLELVSAPGCGTTFRLLLDAAPGAGGGGETRKAPSAHTLGLRGQRVVVVEDDRAARAALVQRLEGWGATVVAFDDVVPALAWARAERTGPDLVLTDYQLPSGTGADVIQGLRGICGTPLCAVVLTGDTRPHDLALLAELQVQVIHKPFRSAALLAALGAASAAVRSDAG